jgi:hypothetical protein
MNFLLTLSSEGRGELVLVGDHWASMPLAVFGVKPQFSAGEVEKVVGIRI